MAGLFSENSTDEADNTVTVIESGIVSETNRAKVDSDNRLWVDAEISGISVPSRPFYDNTMVWEDMNASTGGVARETVITVTDGWTDVYSYSGSGYFHGFTLNLEGAADKWYLRLVVDGVDMLMGSTGIFSKDIVDNNVYDVKDLDLTTVLGIGAHDDSFRFNATETPIKYSTSVAIKVFRDDGGKKFRAGFVRLEKTT